MVLVLDCQSSLYDEWEYIITLIHGSTEISVKLALGALNIPLEYKFKGLLWKGDQNILTGTT